MASQDILERFTETGRKVVCAGVNYRSFIAKEKLRTPTEPVIFLKATSSYVKVGGSVEVATSHQVNAEVELGVVIGRPCRRVSEAQALDFVGGYCVALDMTDITLLNKLRSTSGPWALAKAFDSACPVSAFVPKSGLPDPQRARIWLKVNGQTKQDESTADMVFPAARLVSFVSHSMTLEPGDVLLTGTPAGPCAVRPGDALQCGLGHGLEDVVQASFDVTAALN